MSLTFGIRTARDLLAKLERDAHCLKSEITSDNFFNFIITAYSLIDWVRHDTELRLKQDSVNAACELRKTRWLKICGDIATAAKHHTIIHRTTITKAATAQEGWGVGRFNRGAWGQGEHTVEISLQDGQTFTCLELVEGILSKWRSFFAEEVEQ